MFTYTTKYIYIYIFNVYIKLLFPVYTMFNKISKGFLPFFSLICSLFKFKKHYKISNIKILKR